MGKLFGTDGIRGIANVDLTCELVMKVGRAAATILFKDKESPATVLIGKDTRVSSDMIESALISGLCSVGVNVVTLGVVSTPAVAFLVRKYNADAGIMISASHNPFEFNGIKIFQKDGYKLSDALELEIENLMREWDECPFKISTSVVGAVERNFDAINDYIDYLKSTICGDLRGLRIAFDCSNGSASRSAYKLFSDLGVECFMLNDMPNGININKDCGSVHMNGLANFVRKNNLDAGIAFDGDADRCLAVDNAGNIIDGDIIMAICANALHLSGKLVKNTVVGTVMTNMGFIKFCKENQLEFIAANVGDRYVLEEMKNNGYNFGGEQSGHIIFLDYSTTGDGQLTAIQLLNILKLSGGKFSNISAVMKKFPQILVNVEVTADKKKLLETDENIKAVIEGANRQLALESLSDVAAGRVLVRASGTEPLIRVMIEGEDEIRISELATEIADTIKKQLC